MDQVNLTGWIGREKIAQGQLTSQHLDSWMATMSETRAAPISEDEVVLPMAHWTLGDAPAALDELGEDGHPRLGDFLPPVGLPRRMWAGGALTFHKDLHVGERIARRSVVSDVTEKVGRVGPMVFVTVTHEVSGEDGLAITERQDIVYLPRVERYAPPAKVPAPECVDASEIFSISPVRLFRYSAVTFNGHRIHYDLDFAQSVEMMPGLVVHGPMQSTALAHLAVRMSGRMLDRFEYRSIHPMFHDEDLRLLAVEDEAGQLELFTAAASGGHIGMKARATWGALA